LHPSGLNDAAKELRASKCIGPSLRPDDGWGRMAAY
jgi:hypothetical protein